MGMTVADGLLAETRARGYLTAKDDPAGCLLWCLWRAECRREGRVFVAVYPRSVFFAAVELDLGPAVLQPSCQAALRERLKAAMARANIHWPWAGGGDSYAYIPSVPIRAAHDLAAVLVELCQI